jgi:phosphatidylinositol kinase/protein kinase (PI-3  family)
MGFIEVVLNAETTANIQKVRLTTLAYPLNLHRYLQILLFDSLQNAGGATAVFNTKVLADWLAENNRLKAAYECAVENFTLSLAGYCVATYGMTIGDCSTQVN